mgnify:CR=1 FL=1
MSRKKLLRRAAAAVRQARAEGVDIPRQLTKRSKKQRIIVDDDVLEEMKETRKKLKKSKKEATRDTPYHDDFKAPPKATFSWDFEPGQLVRIKTNPGRRALSMMRYSGVKPGDSGLVVEVSGDYISILGPNGMQSWKCSWVWDVTEDE